MKKIFLILLLTLSCNVIAINFVAECNSCSSYQSKQKALRYSHGIVGHRFVYIFNFSDHNLEKYILFRADNDLETEISFEDAIEYLQTNGIEEKDIVDDNSKYLYKTGGNFIGIFEVMHANYTRN